MVFPSGENTPSHGVVSPVMVTVVAEVVLTTTSTRVLAVTMPVLVKVNLLTMTVVLSGLHDG